MTRGDAMLLFSTQTTFLNQVEIHTIEGPGVVLCNVPSAYISERSLLLPKSAASASLRWQHYRSDNEEVSGGRGGGGSTATLSASRPNKQMRGIR